MSEPWTYPSSPQSANSPPINLPPRNTTLPLPTASSTMHHPTPTPTKPSTPLPWLSACIDASFLFRPKSGSVVGCSVGLEDPPPYLLNPHTRVRASRLLQSNPSFTLPTFVTHNAPLHVHCQRISVVVASVAEAEYAAAFGGGKVLVELTLTLTNLGWPPPTVASSPLCGQRVCDRSCDFFGKAEEAQVDRHAT
jgi:hypothetical protein